MKSSNNFSHFGRSERACQSFTNWNLVFFLYLLDSNSWPELAASITYWFTLAPKGAHVDNVSKRARYLADDTKTRKKCIKNAKGAVVAPRRVARLAYLINNRLNNKSPRERAAVVGPRYHANGVLIGIFRWLLRHLLLWSPSLIVSRVNDVLFTSQTINE